jgi:C-terminal processing protease CtpA/Prc
MQFAYDVAQEWYLWYDELADVSLADFNDPTQLLLALTAPLAPDGRDPGFSYATTISEDEAAFTSGAFVGFGFRYDITPGGQFYFTDVFEGSAAGDAALTRGTEVLAIDLGAGFETIPELGSRGATIEEVFGPSEAGVERAFRVKQGAEIREVTIAKREVSTPPFVDAPLLLEREGLAPVGYINFRSFTSSAVDPLETKMIALRDAGVTDFVIDLRYNGGGLLGVADHMLDLLGGRVAEGQTSFTLTFNDKRSDANEGAVFAPREASVEPLRIAFITTGASASASEMVINSLEPHIETLIVGSNTLGKAVGQSAFDMPGCDTRLRLITFEVLNGEGQGGFYRGLFSTGRFNTCNAADDITRDFTDPNEASLATALGWLDGQSCSSASVRRPLLAPDAQWVSKWSVGHQPHLPDRRSAYVQ